MPDIDPARVARYLTEIDAAATKEEKGDRLESLVVYLFESVPGMRLGARDAVNRARSEEIDLAFWNEHPADGFEDFERIILIECKSGSNPVSSNDVRGFLSKLENRGRQFGILIALAGITGDPADRTSAHQVVAEFLRWPKKIELVVLTRADILTLRTTDDLVWAVRRKLTQLVVTGTVV